MEETSMFRYRPKAAMAAAPALGGLAVIAIYAPDVIKPPFLLWTFLIAFFILEVQLVMTCANAYVELREDHLLAVSWLKVHRYVRYDEIESFGNTWHSDGSGIKVVAPGRTLILTYPLERLDVLRNELRRRCPVREPESISASQQEADPTQ